METKTNYRIPEDNLWKLNKNLGKLNKRAAKLGLSPIVLTEVGTEQVEIKEKSLSWPVDGAMESTGRYRVIHIMTFTGVTPKLAGWALQGTLDGNILTWFASGSKELEIGLTYKLVGTVKAHEEYRGAKQTVVTRVKQAKRNLTKEEKTLLKELKQIHKSLDIMWSASGVTKVSVIGELIERIEYEKGRKI